MRLNKFKLFAEESDTGASAGGAATSGEPDWGALSVEGDIEVDASVEFTGADESSAPAVETAPATAATTSPTASQPAEATPATPAQNAPATTETPAQPATTQTPGSEAPTPQAFNWEEWERTTVETLTPQYALTDEETSAMLTEPEKVLPKMAASVHARVIQNVLAQLPQILPNLIRQIQQADTQENTLRTKFFAVNDDLTDAKFAQAINVAGATFRQLNPTADVETAAFQVGNMVRMALGMPLRSQQQQQVAAAAAPSSRAVPFSPAQGGAGGGGTQAPKNEFEALALEFLENDM